MALKTLPLGCQQLQAGTANCKLALGDSSHPVLLVSRTLQQVHPMDHLSYAANRFGLEGPVKVIYPSVDLVYRSAFPLVRVEIYPN